MIYFFKPKKVLSAKIYNNIEDIAYTESIIIKVKVIKHYQNFFNRKIPYKISAIFNNRKVSLIFFFKIYWLFKKIYPLEEEVFIKGKLRAL